MTFSKLKKLSFLFLLSISVISCTSNSDEEDMMDDNQNPTSNLEKNKAVSTNASGDLKYFSIQDTGTYFQFAVIERIPTNITNPDFGTKVDLMLKELPTQSVTLDHRSEPDFNLVTGEYFFNTANLVSEVWYVPFINSRPTTQLNVVVENGVATFNIENIELSDNFVAPINATDMISVSFSINLSDLNTNSVTFRALAN